MEMYLDITCSFLCQMCAFNKPSLAIYSKSHIHFITLKTFN